MAKYVTLEIDDSAKDPQQMWTAQAGSDDNRRQVLIIDHEATGPDPLTAVMRMARKLYDEVPQ